MGRFHRHKALPGTNPIIYEQCNENVVIAAKGFAMGTANVIPGVSGGTIALLTGIFTELIEALNAIMSPASWKLLIHGKFKRVLEGHPRNLPVLVDDRRNDQHLLACQVDDLSAPTPSCPGLPFSD